MMDRFGAAQIIAIITVAVSALAILFNLDWAVAVGGFIPARVSGELALSGALPWILTPWTAELLHGGWTHLIVNMIMLMLVGPQVERVIGRQGFIVAYVVGALAAAIGQFAYDPSSVIPMVGASGAISTIFGLYSLFYGRPPQISGNQKINRAAHVVWLLITWILINLATAFMAGSSGVLLATPAHVAGFVAGLLLQRPLLMWRYRNA
nr:rhomboid family intramembrane serine protease [uncultured Sphingomonas sp.]